MLARAAADIGPELIDLLRADDALPRRHLAAAFHHHRCRSAPGRSAEVAQVGHGAGAAELLAVAGRAVLLVDLLRRSPPHPARARVCQALAQSERHAAAWLGISATHFDIAAPSLILRDIHARENVCSGAQCGHGRDVACQSHVAFGLVPRSRRAPRRGRNHKNTRNGEEEMARISYLRFGRIAEPVRDAGPRADHRFQAGHRGGAGQSGSRRLAHDQPHVRSAPLQPAQPDQQEQRRAAAHGLDARAAGRHAGIDAGRLSRRHVHERAGRHRAGGRRHQRRPDLGIRARLSEGRQSAGVARTRISASSRT